MDFSFIQVALFFMDSFVNVASSQINVRLVGGSNPKEGRVEILHDGEWGTICTNSWDDRDARVVCRELGLGTTGEDVDPNVFGQGDGRIWLDNVRCTGFENRLDECVSDRWSIHGCGHVQDAAVRCLDFVRLAGNRRDSENEGRVEVFYDGVWGTVCDDDWDERDATVVCRELGLGSSGEAVRNARFDEGGGPIWLDNVDCAGEERSLYMCRHKGWGNENCVPGDDAGVICGNFVRVESGESSSEGRVEVFHDGEWGTVCDDYWDDADATVVCRQLGLGDYGEAVGDARFGEGNGRIWMDDVSCTGLESSLYICRRRRPWGSNNCNHGQDAGVKCYRYEKPIDPTDYDTQTGDAVYTNHPVLYVVISLLVVAVIILAVCIVIIRRNMKDEDRNKTGRFRSIYDGNTSETKKSSPSQVGDANKNESTRDQSEDQGDVYNAAYESSDANYAGGASATSGEEGAAHVYNCVDENTREALRIPDMDCPPKTGVGNPSSVRNGCSPAQDEVHEGTSVKGSSGDNDSYQYVEY